MAEYVYEGSNRKQEDVKPPPRQRQTQTWWGETIRTRLAAARVAICSELVLAVLGVDDLLKFCI